MTLLAAPARFTARRSFDDAREQRRIQRAVRASFREVRAEAARHCQCTGCRSGRR